jgi:kynurenine formamidase
MIDLSKYRIIELSVELCPTIYRLDGVREDPFPSSDLDWNETVVYSGGAKRLVLRQIKYPDMDFNELIDMEAHLGTHAETGKHLDYDRLSITDFPVDTWIGEAVVCDFSHKTPVHDERYELTANDFGKVKKRDIVLIRSSLSYNDAPTMTEEAAKCLIDKKVKLIGGLEPFNGVIGTAELRNIHNIFHENDIVLVQGMINLNQIKKERVFFIGLPMRIKGLDASTIRAIVLEEKD